MKVFRVNNLSSDFTRNLDAELQSKNIVRYDVLPLLICPTDHSWDKNPPPELSVVDFTKQTLNVARAIDVALNHALLMRRTWALNGNRWVMQTTERPPFYLMSEKVPGLIEQNKFLYEDMRIAHPFALNLSIQLRPREIIGTNHVLNIATEYASNTLPTIVAAGNLGKFGPNTLSPLAKLPSTIAVGASTDENGDKLLPSSSTGKENEPGVDFVANGQNMFVPTESGTSFAAPIVSKCILIITGFILQLRCVEETQKTLRLAGVPVLHYYGIDTGFFDYDPKPRMPLPMLPRVGLNQDLIRKTILALQLHKKDNVFEPRKNIVLKILQSCARKMPGYAKHEVGHGFVSETLVFDFLVNLTVEKLLEFFIAPEIISEILPKKLRSEKVTNKIELSYLYQILTESHLQFVYDFKTGQVISTMGASTARFTGQNCVITPMKHTWPNPPT